MCIASKEIIYTIDNSIMPLKMHTLKRFNFKSPEFRARMSVLHCTQYVSEPKSQGKKEGSLVPNFRIPKQ